MNIIDWVIIGSVTRLAPGAQLTLPPAPPG